MDEDRINCDKCGEVIATDQDCWVSVDAPGIDEIDGEYWTLCEECCNVIVESIRKLFK